MILVRRLIIGVIFGFVLGTFGEYWVHRAMHRGLILARNHGEHHREGFGRGALSEFRDYSLATVIAAIVGLPIDYYFFSSLGFAIGLVSGLLIHAIFAAWCHQAQHEDPRLVPWLSKTPVHFVHHKLSQSRYNFGISVDWWDRLFKTYRPEPNWRSLINSDVPPRQWWQLDWIDRSRSGHR
jgi:sterol desaturase/sphingolipid hydroxylase (fatty acid hydroxylase superfamily)